MTEPGPQTDDALDDFLEAMKALHLGAGRCQHGGDPERGELPALRERLDSAWATLKGLRSGETEWIEKAGAELAKFRAQIADDLFYGPGLSESAIREYQGALAIHPGCLPALKGIVAAYLQGERRRPRRALPYAERLAALAPEKAGDLRYVRRLCTEEPPEPELWASRD